MASRRWTGANGGWAVVALGLLLGAGFLANFLHELRTLDVVGPPLLALLLGVAVAGGVTATGVVVRRSGLAGRDSWRVAVWAVCGLLLATTAYGLTVLIRSAEGRPPGEPQLALLVGGGTGTLAGALLGLLHAQLAAAKRSVERSRDSLRFLNSLLRHELLNGLTIVAGNASRLQADATAVEERSEAIVDRSEEMAALVRDLEPVARTFGGDADLEPVDVSAVLRRRVRAARQAFPAAEVESDVPDGLAVRATAAVSHVVENLLVNAIEHNEGAVGRVRVTAADAGDDVRVTVADDGPGISPIERASLFEPDERGGSDGVGLYIASSLVERFGGELAVAESDLGGAAVTARLPAAE